MYISDINTGKIMAENAITSDSYEFHLLLLDMSKAFDTVHRTKLMQQLSGNINRQ